MSIVIPKFKGIEDNGKKLNSQTIGFWASVLGIPNTVRNDYKNHAVLLTSCGKYHDENVFWSHYVINHNKSSEYGELKIAGDRRSKELRKIRKKDEKHGRILKALKNEYKMFLDEDDVNDAARPTYTQRCQTYITKINELRSLINGKLNVVELTKKCVERYEVIESEICARLSEAATKAAHAEMKKLQKDVDSARGTPLSSIVFIRLMKLGVAPNKEQSLYWPAIELDMNLVEDELLNKGHIVVEHCMTSAIEEEKKTDTKKKTDQGNIMDAEASKWLRPLYYAYERLREDKVNFGVKARYFCLITADAFKFVVVGPKAEAECISYNPIVMHAAFAQPDLIKPFLSVLPLWTRSSRTSVWLLKGPSATTLTSFTGKLCYQYPFYEDPDDEKYLKNIDLDKDEERSLSSAGSDASSIVHSKKQLNETSSIKSEVDLEKEDEKIDAMIDASDNELSGQDDSDSSDDDEDDDGNSDDDEYVTRKSKHPRIDEGEGADEERVDGLQDLLDEFDDEIDIEVRDLVLSFRDEDAKLKREQDSLNVITTTSTAVQAEKEKEVVEEVFERRILPPRKAALYALSRQRAFITEDEEEALELTLFAKIGLFEQESEFSAFLQGLKSKVIKENQRSNEVSCKEHFECAQVVCSEQNMIVLMKAMRFVLEYAIYMKQTFEVDAPPTSTTNPLQMYIYKHPSLFGIEPDKEDVEESDNVDPKEYLL